jgi:transposase InsO family protein
MSHFIPFHSNKDALGLCEIVLQDPVYLHGIPATIILDYGPQFGSTFWGHIFSHLVITQRMSTAVHLQTDAQMEQMSADMEQYN